MQKKLIAIAIAGLSSVAFAQTNVNVSGRLSVNIDNGHGCDWWGSCSYDRNWLTFTEVGLGLSFVL